VVDALGGMLKAHARRLVLSRKMVISNAADFFHASADLLGVKLMEYKTKEVEDIKEQYGAQWVGETVKLRYDENMAVFVASRMKAYTMCDTSFY